MTDQLIVRSSGMPERIGPYRVVGRLGKGAMGIVYRARDDQMMRDVAVKLLMTDVEDEPETRTRFFREAQITSRLQHRNVVTVLDVGEDDGRLFIVMELLRGETLTEFIKRPVPATIEQQIDLMIQTCEGLAVAHTKGIVHRDIKPGNLFVLTDGSLKILDFGVAHLASSTMTASGLILGTPDYMSPEQARGQDIDGRSDIFSTGAVFYLMLTGRRPFDGPNLPAVLQRVIKEDPLPIREHEAPLALARIINKALRKDVSERYQRFADMVADLVRFRRQFDNETRQLVSTARERFDDVRRRAGEIKRLRAALLMPPAVDIAEPAALAGQFPFFAVASDGVPPVSMPTVRHRVMSIITDLQVAQEPIADELARLQAAVQDAERAEQALLARDPRVALDHLNRAGRSLRAASERLVSGKAKAEQLLADLQRPEHRAGELLEEARSAAGRLERPVVAPRERLRERAGVPAKSAEAGPHVARGAERLAAAGRLRKAASDAQVALTLDAGRLDAVTIREDSQRLEAQAVEKRRSEIKKSEAQAEFAAILTSVRRAIRANEFQRAVGLAENGVRVGVHGRAAEELLAEAKQAFAVNRKAIADRDSRDGSSTGREVIIDLDDTVILAAPPRSGRGFLTAIAERVRRWRRKRGHTRSGH